MRVRQTMLQWTRCDMHLMPRQSAHEFVVGLLMCGDWGGYFVESVSGAPHGAAGDLTCLAVGANIATQPDKGKRASEPPRSVW